MARSGATYAGTCYIGVGANINPERNIIRGLVRLNSMYPLTGVSTFYRTKAIDRPEQPDFLNGVISIHYTGVLRALKFDVLRKLETLLGRERSKDAYAPRPIDFDILLCGRLVLREPDLIVPDPDIRKRPFLIAALLELDMNIELPDNRGPLKGVAGSPELKQLQAARSFSKGIKERFEK